MKGNVNNSYPVLPLDHFWLGGDILMPPLLLISLIQNMRAVHHSFVLRWVALVRLPLPHPRNRNRIGSHLSGGGCSMVVVVVIKRLERISNNNHNSRVQCQQVLGRGVTAALPHLLRPYVRRDVRKVLMIQSPTLPPTYQQMSPLSAVTRVYNTIVMACLRRMAQANMVLVVVT